MNGAVLPILALFVVAAEEAASRRKSCRARWERHSERVHGAQHLYLSAPHLDAVISDIFAFTSQKMPKFNIDSISGYICGADGDAGSELAYTLADGVEYVALRMAGPRTLITSAPRLSFFWAIGMEKPSWKSRRCVRPVSWAKLMKDFKPRGCALAIVAADA